jgi:hypothetical protein
VNGWVLLSGLVVALLALDITLNDAKVVKTIRREVSDAVSQILD